MTPEILDQPVPFLQGFRLHGRHSEKAVKIALSDAGPGVIQKHKNPVHIQVIPGDIVNDGQSFFFPMDIIMGNGIKLFHGIFPFRPLPIGPLDLPKESLSVFISFPDHKNSKGKKPQDQKKSNGPVVIVSIHKHPPFSRKKEAVPFL